MTSKNDIRKKLTHPRTIGMIFTFLSLCLTFAAGAFSSNTQLEKISEYAAHVVKNYTAGKELCAVMVAKTDSSGSLPLPYDEFNRLYGTFKQTKITFASAVNPDKSHQIFSSELSDNNLSFFYFGPTGSKVVDGQYRHFVYPIDLMFADENYGSISRFVTYISKSHADKLLKNKGLPTQDGGTYSLDSYKSLLKSPISVSFDGKPSDLIIQNIYFETGYYFDGLKEIMGDFLISSYYLPGTIMSEQKNMYFMSDYPYQNKYFMSYINEVYSSKKYDVKVNHYNLNEKIEDNFFLEFYYSKASTRQTMLSILLFTLFGAFVLVAMTLVVYSFIFVEKIKWWKYAIYVATMFVPYILFFVLYTLTGNVLFLSETATKVNGISILAFSIIYFVTNFIIEKREKKQYMHMRRGASNEFDI